MEKTCQTCKYENEPAADRPCKNCLDGPDGGTNWVDKAHKARIKAAQTCQAGACNPIPISKALHDAIMEVHKEGGDARKDAAVYLILHQLSYILVGTDFVDPARYTEAMREIGS